MQAPLKESKPKNSNELWLKKYYPKKLQDLVNHTSKVATAVSG